MFRPHPRKPSLLLKLTLGSVEVQAGEQGMFPLTGGGVTVSHALQVVASPAQEERQRTFFTRSSSSSPLSSPTAVPAWVPLAARPISRTPRHFELGQHAGFRGGGSTGRDQLQSRSLALIKSLSNRGGSGQLSIFGVTNLKPGIKAGTIQATTQFGPVFEADPPQFRQRPQMGWG